MYNKLGLIFSSEVFKGPSLSTHKIHDLRTHFKPTENFSMYTLLILPHFKLQKRSFIKGEELRLSIYLNRGREESVGNDDVSIVCARKCEMVRMT